MHKHQPSISSTRTNDEGLDGAVPPASVFLFVAHPIIASTTATPTPPTHSLTLSLTLTPTPTPTPTRHTHISRLHCLFSSPSPSPSVSCDVVGDSHRRSFCGPGRPPNHLSYTHLLSPLAKWHSTPPVPVGCHSSTTSGYLLLLLLLLP